MTDDPRDHDAFDDVEAAEDEAGTEPGAIGVGMGGSCPNCRAPIDLGQEFCLECGAPIRFTPRQRRKPRPAAAAAAGTAAPPSRRGFPWIPFLIVLALIGGGIAFALMDGGDKSSSRSPGTSTEDALPEITNSVPETSSTTSTTTLQDCDPSSPLAGTEPAIPGVDPSSDSLPPVGEQIPELADSGQADGFPADDPDDPAFGGGSETPSTVPATTPSPSGANAAGATVTVDQDGNLCPDDSSDAGALPGDTDDLDPIDSDEADEQPSGTSESGDWPAGQSGWTVIVFGYPTRERATQSAVDLQQDGFSDGGVLYSNDFPSLCPGFHVVYSGRFDAKREAAQRKSKLQQAGYAGMYVREIRAGGAPASNCETTK